MQELHITPGSMPPECEQLRQEVRAFLAQEMPAYSKVARAKNWSGKDQAFSKKLAERGAASLGGDLDEVPQLLQRESTGALCHRPTFP